MKKTFLHPDVSIIIVNYHTSSLIDDCIDSIFTHTKGCRFEIIVVDNASESLSETLRNASKEEVTLLQLRENIGFGRANNAAANIAKGKYLFFLNPDTLLLNDAVSILYRFLEGNPGCGACGGNLFDVNGNPASSFKRFFPGPAWELNELLHLLPEKLLYGKNRNFNHTSTPIKTAYVTGADLMISKKLFDELGGFAPEFFMYYEETDLCRRIHNKGLDVNSVPQAKIIHLEGKNRLEGIPDWKIKVIEESRAIYYRRNHSPIIINLSNLLYSFFLRSRILLSRDPSRRAYYLRRLHFFRREFT